MLGAIIGDIIGSRFEGHNYRAKDFELFTERNRATDDSILTMAIARAVWECNDDFTDLSDRATKALRDFYQKEPHRGYGRSFKAWGMMENPQPMNSFGNGAAMRVSPVAYAARSLSECLELSDKVTAVTHNHPEGIKGARAEASCVYLALHGASKAEIEAHIQDHYYDLQFSLEDARARYICRFDSSCMGTVPQAIRVFLDSDDYLDTIRTAVNIGGDSDTICAMSGAIAEAFYGLPSDSLKIARHYCPAEMLCSVELLYERYGRRETGE